MNNKQELKQILMALFEQLAPELKEEAELPADARYWMLYMYMAGRLDALLDVAQKGGEDDLANLFEKYRAFIKAWGQKHLAWEEGAASNEDTQWGPLMEIRLESDHFEHWL